MAYHHNSTFYKNKKRSRKFTKFAVLFSIVVLLISGFIAVDWYRTLMSDSKTVVSKENIAAVQSANVSVYRTEYYQFQAPDSWVLLANLSTDNKFVYVKQSKTQHTQRIVVYVDEPEAKINMDYRLTNVLPVDISDDGKTLTNIGEVSEHCGKSWPKDRPQNPGRNIHEGIDFLCTPDSQEYNVVVGVRGKSEDIVTTDKSGSGVKLNIVFSDLSAYPGTGDLYNIISTFTIL